MGRSSPRRIVFVVYDGISLLDLAGPLEAFCIASRLVGGPEPSPLYECSVVSSRGGPVMTSDGIKLVTEPIRALRRQRIDTLIAPGAFLVDDVTRDKALVDWVGSRASQCRRLCSVCVGSFLLAAAGVLH